MSFLRTGKAAARALRQENEAQAARDKAREDGAANFWLRKGETREITFLDGELLPSGELDFAQFYQHRAKMQGRWDSFVCTAYEDREQPCPLCEMNNWASFVGAFTVIDHTEYEVRGEKKKNTTKLFIATKQTLQMLQELATQYGGLAGHVFRVTRTDAEKTPQVGNLFNHRGRRDPEKAMAHYGTDIVDYEKAIVYRTPEELRALGFGDKSKAGDMSYENEGAGLATDEADYYDDDELPLDEEDDDGELGFDDEEDAEAEEVDDEEAEYEDDEEVEYEDEEDEEEPPPPPPKKKRALKKRALKKKPAAPPPAKKAPARRKKKAMARKKKPAPPSTFLDDEEEFTGAE